MSEESEMRYRDEQRMTKDEIMKKATEIADRLVNDLEYQLFRQVESHVVEHLRAAGANSEDISQAFNDMGNQFADKLEALANYYRKQ